MQKSPTLYQEIKDFSRMLFENSLFVKISADNTAVLVYKGNGVEHTYVVVKDKLSDTLQINPCGKGQNPIDSLIEIMRNMPAEGIIQIRDCMNLENLKPLAQIEYSF